jgi:hypothetical protein
MARVIQPWQRLLAALAIKDQILDRRVLATIATIATHDTILRSQRQPVLEN